MPSPRYSPIHIVGGFRGSWSYGPAPLKGSKESVGRFTWNPVLHVMPPSVLNAATTSRRKSPWAFLLLFPFVYQATMISPNLSMAAVGKRLKLLPGPAASVFLVQVLPKSLEVATTTSDAWPAPPSFGSSAAIT